MDSIIYLSPIKNTNNKGNTKYSIKDYIIGVIDVCKNSTSWNSYNGYILIHWGRNIMNGIKWEFLNMVIILF